MGQGAIEGGQGGRGEGRRGRKQEEVYWWVHRAEEDRNVACFFWGVGRGEDQAGKRFFLSRWQ